MGRVLVVWCWVATVMAAVVPPAAISAESAREILDRRKALDDTTRKWTDRHQRLHMTIVDARGGERVRDLDLYERKEANDEQKQILFFQAPVEIKGTGFLAFIHKGAAADQWLYLPELKRVRVIAGTSRNESFMGSDLSYHDIDLIAEMPSWSELDAPATLLPPEPVDGVPCHVIELLPKRDDIGYRRIVQWLGADDLVPRRLEFDDDGPAPRKRLRQTQIQLVGAVPVAHELDIETPANGTRTHIVISDVQLNQNLEDDLFTQRALERGGR